MNMRIKLSAAVVSATALTGVLALSGISAHASPAPATVTTCHAFTAWNHHRTTVNLDAMVVASLTAPWNNLANDVNVVYADVRGGNHTDLAGDVAGIASDCR